MLMLRALNKVKLISPYNSISLHFTFYCFVLAFILTLTSPAKSLALSEIDLTLPKARKYAIKRKYLLTSKERINLV